MPFEVISSVVPYDDTTLFCPAGMQKYKKEFVSSTSGKTLGNIQSCIRLNDIDCLGDGTHLGHFKMIGTFSFRHWSVQQTIDFWMKFLTERLGLKVGFVTIHPDVPEWNSWHTVPVRYDDQCKWSDGNIGGYCTEFYINDIEIGNIVNPLGDCIDVGFGLERLDMVVNNTNPKSKEESLIDLIDKIIESGYTPSHKRQGYVLRRLIRSLYKMGGKMSHPFFEKERERQTKMTERYQRLLPKNLGKTKEWWFSTHGVEVD